MKKNILAIILFWGIHILDSTADTHSSLPMGIIVPAGTTLVINERNELPLAVDVFVLHDRATLSINPDIESIEFTARRAYFGNEARIVSNGRSLEGRGSDGSTGSRGAECNDGGAGTSGSSGRHGQKGLDMILNLGVVAFGSLSIHANGGDGSAGGNGGQGGPGGIARVGSGDLCSGGNGGTGGSGGAGGAAGRGGNITIEWWEVIEESGSGLPESVPSASGLQVFNKAGESGPGGSAGKGGTGGGSKCRNILFAKVCKGAGHGGKSGTSGRSGYHASDGEVVISRRPS